jgi:hypothetical protein
MLLPVAVALSAMLPVLAAELEALLDDTTTELEDLLDEVAAMELDDLLEGATELAGLDDATTTELEDLLEGATELATELLAPPQIAVVRVAPFLPTPATLASLSFTHWGDTGA